MHEIRASYFCLATVCSTHLNHHCLMKTILPSFTPIYLGVIELISLLAGYLSDANLPCKCSHCQEVGVEVQR